MNSVRILGENESVSLPEPLLPSIGFVGLDPWLFFTKKVYGFLVYRIVSQSDTEINGWLALVRVKHPIFGNYLSTAPFGSYGGFAYASNEVRNMLLEKVRDLSDSLGVKYCVLRFLNDGQTPPEPWMQDPIYSTYFIDLPKDADELWSRFGSQHRKHTRQALKKGFQTQFGHLELLDEIYDVLERSMHELGSPYHSKKYLRDMAEALGGQLEFVVLKDAEGVLAGSAVLVYQDGMATNLHANILQQFRTSYAGEVLYWSILEHYCQKGMQVCDMGRSLNGSGNETYKMKWRPRKAPLAYWYYLPKGDPIPELNQRSARFQFIIRIWQLLPSFVVRALGPNLIRGIV